MPLLALLIGNGLSAFFGLFASDLIRKIAGATLLAGFIVGLWTALQVTIRALVDTLGGNVLPDWMAGPLAIVVYLLPDNFTVCATAIAGAYTARWVMDVQREWAKSVASA